MIGVSSGKLGKLVRKLEKQLKSSLYLETEEVIPDLGELFGELILRHCGGLFSRYLPWWSGTGPGAEPCTIGTRTAEPHSVHEPS